MKKALLFTTVFSIFLYGTILVSEQAMSPQEEAYESVGVLSESYDTSSQSYGVMSSNLDLDGWVPVDQIRGPGAPIIGDTPPARGPAQPNVRTNAGAVIHPGHHYVNNCQQRPICNGYYRTWSYQRGQPVRNAVRFFHNRRPLRRLIGGLFGRRCR